MRICLVSQEYPPETARGGIGSQTWNKARALVALGHTVHVLSSSATGNSALRTEVHDGITVHRLCPPGNAFPVYHDHTFWLGYSWSVLQHLNQLLEAHQYDLIDIAEYGAEGFAYQLDRTPWNWAAVVVQLHGPLALMTETLGWPDPHSDFAQIGASMEGVSIRKADALMACSANIADFTARYYNVERAAIDVVHCGVDARAFIPGRNGDGDGRPTVLFVGNLSQSKGIGATLKAVLRVRERIPNLRVEILGKGDPEAVAELRARIQEAGAGDTIELVGFVGDRTKMPAYYRRATVFCSPAEHEMGVANVYIEAMACGCPVIAGNTGGAPEAVIDGESGLLVPPGDADAIAAALRRLLENRELARRMGEAGRRRVDEYFAMERYIGRVLGTYERALAVAREKRRRLERSAGADRSVKSFDTVLK